MIVLRPELACVQLVALTITSDLVSTHHHMDTAHREDVPVFSVMLAIATHSFPAGSYRSTELSRFALS